MKKYHIIYCDPPWSYRDKKKSGRTKCGAENHYPTLTEKPEEVRRRIEELWGNVSRVELFTRKKVEEWDSIGFDIDGRDIREVLEGYNE